MAKKEVQEINAGSMADISFLLLIFWLTTTTMDVDKGIQRRLPPMPDKETQQNDVKVNRRNIIQVKISMSDRIFAGTQAVDISQVKDKILEFITNPTNSEALPERVMTDVPGFGKYPVSQGVVSLQNDRGTSYNMYIQVQNEILKAYDEVRDDFSMKNYGKKFAKLSEAQQDVVRKAIPQTISEAEPKDVSKK